MFFLVFFNYFFVVLIGVFVFFVFIDRGGNLEVWFLGWVGDLDFIGEGLGVVLFVIGEVLVVVLFFVGEGLGVGLVLVEVGWGEFFDVDFFILFCNFFILVVCIFCVFNDIWSVFFSLFCFFLVILVSFKKIKELKLVEK